MGLPGRSLSRTFWNLDWSGNSVFWARLTDGNASKAPRAVATQAVNAAFRISCDLLLEGFSATLEDGWGLGAPNDGRGSSRRVTAGRCLHQPQGRIAGAQSRQLH